MGTAVLVASGKGGTGKTTMTAGVGSCLAALGNQVLCIDLDIGLRNLDIALGMDDRAVMDFSDVMEERCSLRSGVSEHPDIPGLCLLTAPLRLKETDAERFFRLVQEAKETYDFVLMDAPAGLGEGFQLGLHSADRAIVVSATDPAALRDAQRAVAELIRTVPVIHLVMNRVEAKVIRRLHTTIDEAMDTAGLPLLGVVPEDNQVLLAAGQGQPLALYAHKGAVRACLNIAKRLMGERVPLMKSEGPLSLW